MGRLVTVYIPTHNRVDMLRRAVNSVLNQSCNNVEVIICDDASMDGTRDYATNLAAIDSRVRYLRNESPEGACAARNLGIMAANGEFITGLDDDDEFLPDRVSRFLELWRDGYSFICGNFVNRGSGRDVLEYKGGGGIAWRDLLIRNVASNQIFTLTERLRSIGGFDVRVKRLQDWDTWLRLGAEFGDFYRDADATYVMHHDHVNSAARVSRSIKISDAMESLVCRNEHLFDDASRKFMMANINFLRGKLAFSEALGVAVSNTKLKPLAWFLAQKMVSRDY